MKLCTWRKDGGPESRVDGFFVVELKSLFSVVILRFGDGTRNTYHSHAFNAISWLLRGHLREFNRYGGMPVYYWPSLRPIYTPRSRFHKVASGGTSWAISFRGPWANAWQEYAPATEKTITLTSGRRPL